MSLPFLGAFFIVVHRIRSGEHFTVKMAVPQLLKTNMRTQLPGPQIPDLLKDTAGHSGVRPIIRQFFVVSVNVETRYIVLLFDF